ncbi:acyl-CoA dehydrogenase family protein [Prauserella oleivorans]
MLRCAITGVALGVARRALHELVTTARQRSRLGAVTRMSEQPLLRVELNRAVLAFRAARQLALAELEELPRTGRDPAPFPCPGAPPSPLHCCTHTTPPSTPCGSPSPRRAVRCCGPGTRWSDAGAPPRRCRATPVRRPGRTGGRPRAVR